jgi:hypothetical protein
MHNYLTVSEIAQRLERQPETVATWLAEGRLPSLQIQDGLVVPIVALWPYRQVSESDE